MNVYQYQLCWRGSETTVVVELALTDTLTDAMAGATCPASADAKQF
jgi:hypothetical protein